MKLTERDMPPNVDAHTGELIDPAGCEQCERLAAELRQANHDVAVAETELRRQRRSIGALRAQLADKHRNAPNAAEVRRVLEHWQRRCGHPRAAVPLDGKRAAVVRKMLAEFDADKLCMAVEGAARMPFVGPHGRQAEAGNGARRFDDIELICRDETQVEKFVAFATADETPPVPRSPQAPPRRSGPAGVQAVLDRLEHVKEARPGEQWEARCPAHDDRHASLSVGQGAKGAVLTCHAGCDTGEIVGALGLELTQLFDPDHDEKPALPAATPEPTMTEAQLAIAQQRLLAHDRLLDRLLELRGWTPPVMARLGLGFDGERVVIPCRDRAGVLIGAVRYLPGERPAGARKLLAPRGTRRELFPPPETLDPDARVWVCEGESDAVTGHELGLAATGVPGVNGWKADWAQRFTGRDVVIAFDCDEPGRKAAEKVATLLAHDAHDVRVLDLEADRTDGFDLTDAFAEGATAEILNALADQVLPVEQMRVAA